jgi:hypothetical protein
VRYLFIATDGTLEYSTDEDKDNDYYYGIVEPIGFESTWLQNENDVKKLANWIKEKVPGVANNSIYLIDEDDDFKLVYDKGIAMFDLTVKKGILVSESIKLSSSLTKNKEDLTRVIELLIHKLNEPNRNNSSSL